MSDVALPPDADFVENSARMQAAYYREEAARFRSLAELEPVAALRRHLASLARQYEQIADDLVPKARDLLRLPRSTLR